MARIGIDAHVLDGKFQGSRTWTENVLLHLPKTPGGHTWVIYSADPSATRAQYPAPCFEHRRIGAKGRLARLLLFWPFAAVRHGLDALVTNYVAPPLCPARQIVVLHDLLFESNPGFFPPLMRWRLKLLCRLSAWRAAAILTCTRHAKAEIAQRYRVPEGRIHLAPAAAAPPAPPGDEDLAYIQALQPYFLCVGRLERRKNIGLALTASAPLRAESIRLVVVGREDTDVGDLPQALAEAPGVVHLRDASPALLSGLYAGATALIFPSLGEGFGIPVVEALASGTAVIASAHGAIMEAGGTVTHYFDPTSPDAAATLEGLMRRAVVGELTPDPVLVAAHLAQFDWARSAAALDAVATEVKR
ncbi:glycosyltransferase family 1 protein [Sediminicoccus sp. KRV36]|uniref:glycosyltransferase family 4 protein n=1 Tax=Sediminicoccus sp. KRV36 TaxID=3133721 RepID=UPI002010838E|nr:glycosyltransferase family 1 protein [Sediminicoccus rosea]UPY36715.1 glycosyltransferase family 4 protein [Sediminicoccus rosea]